MITKKLLNCPLCGSEPIDRAFGIECPNCKLWLPASEKEWWNKRSVYTEQELNDMEKKYEQRTIS